MYQKFLFALLSCLIIVGCAPAKYQGSSQHAAMQAAIAEFGEKEARKYGMRLLFVGNFTCFQNTPYAMAFTSDKELSLEKGRVFAITLVRDFLKMLQNAPSMKSYRAISSKSIVTSEYTPRAETVGLKIGFWDKDVNRPKRPNLAEILFVDGAFYYYEPDPETLELRLVLKESYEEAEASRL